MNRIDHEDFLPLPESWSANFELTLAIAKKGIEVRELDDKLNDALDVAYDADRYASLLSRELNELKAELLDLRRELARRESLLRKVGL